jgi:hypothetical protein
VKPRRRSVVLFVHGAAQQSVRERTMDLTTSLSTNVVTGILAGLGDVAELFGRLQQ